MFAHIRESDGLPQPLDAHCRNVSRLCAQAAQPLGLKAAAQLIGLLHDMGKATQAFRVYLLARDETAPSPHYHAPTGAIFTFRRWFSQTGASASQRLAAQIVAMCIHGHHASLADCLSDDGTSPFLKAMQPDPIPPYVAEATDWFLEHVAAVAELDALFAAANAEIQAFLTAHIQPQRGNDLRFSQLGLLTRLLLSILVDADRWDSACFNYGQDPFSRTPSAPDWQTLFATFESFRRTQLNEDSRINRIRTEISDTCLAAATAAPGIITLSVPTGGGKTYASLRYALRHAAAHGQRRIFYIIPYNTILDQNAADIRAALNDYPSILEHHANVVLPTEDEQQAYRRLTERWDSDIILTSLVQFLNACYAAPNTDARRMHRLTNAVLIFDEIQSLPKHCKTLFERAITFLSACCGSTVVLCTATQPQLTLPAAPTELMPDVSGLYTRLQRVEYLPQLTPPHANRDAAADIARMLAQQSVLTIVNTKAAAWEIYSETTRLLRESGYTFAAIDTSLPDTQIRSRARESTPGTILCVHMSTLLCPAHRQALIRWIKIWLHERRRVLCVSTALIEAGINVSFPVVVRSLTGLPSIVQAAGRANRSMEYPKGQVYIWDLYEEKLSFLPDIQNGGNITRSLLAGRTPEYLNTPEAVADYFAREQDYTNRYKDDPFHDTSLADLLAQNRKRANGASYFRETAPLVLRQSFRTANCAFAVIAQATKPVLVPFGDGESLIAELCCWHNMQEEIRLLRKAQSYSVALYDNMFRRLQETGALYTVGETGVLALTPGFYDPQGGVQPERAELPDMIF